MSEVWLTVWFLAMGGGLLFFSIGIWRANSIVKKWPETSAMILEKKLVRSSGRGRGFRPHIDYGFKVSGVLYHSTKVYKTFLESMPQDQAQKKLDQFSSSPKVRYNPSDPNDCCMTVIRFGALQWFFLILGAVFFVFGLLSLLALLINQL
jgi:hypothetical protein